MSTHDERIRDQFTRQAEPFSKVKWHNHEALLELILESAGIGENDRVLDVACGPGIVACEAAKHARSVTGIDLVPAMIDLAKKRQAEAGLANVDWRVGDVYSLPFKGAAYSRVMTRFSFHHFTDPAAVLKEMWRVASDGARIVVTDVYASNDPEVAAAYDRMETLRDPSHVRALRLGEMLDLFETMDAEDVRTEFFRLEADLDKQLAASFPNPGDDEKIRELFRRDLSENRMGVNPVLKDGKVHFSYPIVVLSGRKR